MQDYRVSIGSIGKNVKISRVQGTEGGAILDCAEITMLRKNRTPVILRLDRAEVHELVGLLAAAFRNDFLTG